MSSRRIEFGISSDDDADDIPPTYPVVSVDICSDEEEEDSIVQSTSDDESPMQRAPSCLFPLKVPCPYSSPEEVHAFVSTTPAFDQTFKKSAMQPELTAAAATFRA